MENSKERTKETRNSIGPRSWDLTVIEEAPAPILINGPDRQVVYGNRAFRRVVGSEDGELSSLNLQNICHPDDLERVQESDERLMHQEDTSDDMILRVDTPRGLQRVLTHRYAVPLPDGRCGVMNVAIPLADHDYGLKPIKGRWLHEMEEGYRSFFKAVDYPLAVVSVEEGRFLDVNPAFEVFYGYDWEWLKGRSLADLSVSASTEALRRLLSNAVPTAVFRHRLSNGNTREVEVHSSPVVFEGLTARAVMVRDITDRVQAEEELQEALGRAEAVSRARNEFLANVSHEFRTPVSGIIGIATLLRDSELNPDQIRLLALLEAAAGDLERMLRDMLDISRIDVGKVRILRKAFSIPEMLNRVIGLHRNGAEGRGLSLQWNYEGPVSYVGDETRLVQILNNLLDNAIKNTDAGSIDVFAQVDQGLMIEIRDTGRGIPEGKRDEIFDMFQQVENPYTKDRHGLGLGLTIVRSLLELMDGEITVTDNPGGGTVFRVLLPDGGEHSCQERDGAVSNRILVVEDDALSRYYLATILRKRGFDAVEAEDGESAVDLFAPESYLAVLMDVGLPRQSGIEVTRILRRLEEGCHPTPIWAVTAHGFQTDMEQCYAAGMDDFFLKPVDEERLISRLNALSQGRKSQH